MNLNASAVKKHNIGEGTVEPLTKAKGKMKVKSKVVVCSTEKSSKFCTNTSSKISMKARLRQWLQNSVLFRRQQNTFFQNNNSAFINKNFVDQEITGLINTGRVKEVENVPYTVNTLSVSERSDKLRLILDLRHTNMHVHEYKVKFEDWDDMLNYVENDCFTVLPFGLTSVLFIFTKIMRVLVKHWRENNVKICYFLDDGAEMEVAFYEVLHQFRICKKFSNTVQVCRKSRKICLVSYHKYDLPRNKFRF